jgi:hypothetical protein
MTESYKLHVFICIESDSNLRFIFVCEDNSESLMQELHGSVLNMVDEFKKQGLLEAMELCESDMFSKISKYICVTYMFIDMQEVQNVLMVNVLMEQYTVYNLPVIYPDEMLPTHVRAIQEFEKLFT